MLQKCLSALDFLVVQDIFLTETAKLADVVLPSTCFAEKEGTFSNTERKVLRVRKALDPPGEAWDDSRVISAIAERMGYPMNYADASAIMTEINSLTPSYGGNFVSAELKIPAWFGRVRLRIIRARPSFTPKPSPREKARFSPLNTVLPRNCRMRNIRPC